MFENELKWYSTEPQQGKVDYTIPDQMLEFIRANQITIRGHNIFWENPIYTPSWVQNLTGPELKLAVNSRINSLMSHYKNEFVHWDVSNEMLHYNFYEQRLGPNASLEFFETAQSLDPLATMFMNDFNVVETCDDHKSTVDAYISRLRELKQGGVLMDGIGLEGHFTIPNPPLIRAVLDKLATLELPIWFTEVDISNTIDKETQVSTHVVVLCLSRTGNFVFHSLRNELPVLYMLIYQFNIAGKAFFAIPCLILILVSFFAGYLS